MGPCKHGLWSGCAQCSSGRTSDVKKKVFAVVKVVAEYYEAESIEAASYMFASCKPFRCKIIDPPKIYEVPEIPKVTDPVKTEANARSVDEILLTSK